MMGLVVTIEIIPDPELGGFTARAPAYGEGESEEEAIQDLKVALRGFMVSERCDESIRNVAGA